MKLIDWWFSPLFGIGVTILAYTIALELQKKWRHANPLFITSSILIGMLLLCGIPYEAYKVGGDFVVFVLGPATVALGVPLYKQAGKMKRDLLPIVAGITAGCISGIGSSAFFVWLSGGPREIMLAMMPKSVTTPISMEIVRQLGGMPELGAVFTVLTGLLGSMAGPSFLRLTGIRSDIPQGAAMGTSSHGIGTSKVVRESELQGGVSSFAMAAAGIITSVLVIPLYWWMQP